MRASLAKRLLQAAITADRCSMFHPLFRCASPRYSDAAQGEEETPRERGSPGVSYGLNWSLATRGIIVKDKTFHNLTSSELQQHGGRTVGHLSGFPIFVRGDVLGRSTEISKSQFSKLLKQVTVHVSSVSNIFIQDGAIGSLMKSGAKVRVISDCPSAALSLSGVLWNIPYRAITRDPSTLIVYIAALISPKIGEIIGLKPEMRNGFVAADMKKSSLVLCGRAFADVDCVKSALTALALPIMYARGGLPLSARALRFGDSVVVLFASKEMMASSFPDLSRYLTSAEAGILLSSEGISPLFPVTGIDPLILKESPKAFIFCYADSSGVLPEVAKLYPGQAAYHYLAGYQDGKFVPDFFLSPSSIPLLGMAKALFSHLKSSKIPSFLVNVHRDGKYMSGNDLGEVIESTLTGQIPYWRVGPTSDPRVGDLKGKYRGFLSGMFPEIPEEFSF